MEYRSLKVTLSPYDRHALDAALIYYATHKLRAAEEARDVAVRINSTRAREVIDELLEKYKALQPALGFEEQAVRRA